MARRRSPIDLADEIAVARLGAVVHHDQRDLASRCEPDERVVLADAPDVVDGVGAGIERGRGDAGLGRVDRERHRRQRRANGADDRDRPAQLLHLVDGRVARPGGFAADVEEVGARRGHLDGLGDGGGNGVVRGEQAVAGERIRGHVQDAHHERPLAPAEGPRPDARLPELAHAPTSSAYRSGSRTSGSSTHRRRASPTR